MDRATRRFQRRNGLGVDGILDPEGETFRTLEDESFGGDDADECQREADRVQNRVQLDNVQIRLDRATRVLEVANESVMAP